MNPAATSVTRHRRGDIRGDGYRFWAYERRQTRLGIVWREKWRSPESYRRGVGFIRQYLRRYHKGEV